MAVEWPDYLGQLQRSELSLIQAVVPWLVGTVVFWLVRRLGSSLRILGPWAIAWGGAAGALLGLALVHTTYPCPTCEPFTRGCRVVIQGVPFPQEHMDRDPEPVVWYDICRVAKETSPLARGANFLLGVLVVPGVLLLAIRGVQRARASREPG